MISRARKLIQKLPDKKRYLDFFTAALTVPVLFTVIYLNISNIQSKPKTAPEPSATPVPTLSAQTVTIIKEIRERIAEPQVGSVAAVASPSAAPSTEACNPSLGPVSIVSPREGEVVNYDNLCYSIKTDPKTYCPAEWSYRINGGSWSEYIDTDICLFNLDSGKITMELRVRSTQSAEETTLIRTVEYRASDSTPSPQPTASAEPSLSPAP